LIEPLVVIVPAYNAEPTLAKVVKDVRRNLPGALIIGVDDGSTDGSRRLLRTMADETIEFDQNRGKGAALRAGFDAALNKGAAAVLTIDSDGQHDAAFAPAIVGALDRADIVIGTRDLSGKAVPRHRRIANMISSAATRAVSGGKVRDSQSGYRARSRPRCCAKSTLSVTGTNLRRISSFARLVRASRRSTSRSPPFMGRRATSANFGTRGW